MTSTCDCAGDSCTCILPASSSDLTQQPLRIAIDFGGVLSKKDAPSKTDDKAQSKGHRSTAIDMPGAPEALSLLSTRGHQLVLLSFCGKTRALGTKKAILEHAHARHWFRDLFFVKDILNKKLVVAAAKCNVMIDDTLDILLDIAKSDDCKGVVLVWFRPAVLDEEDQPTEKEVALVQEHKILVATSWDTLVSLDKLILRKETAGTFDPATEGIAIKKKLISKLYVV